MRASFQVLAFPFIKEGDNYLYAIFKRKDMSVWQAISGGGEDNENPVEAMKREVYEEAALAKDLSFIRLSALSTIPAVNIRGLMWGEEIVMIPEFTFGIESPSKEFQISDEHTEYGWFSYEEAVGKLKYDSNKSALWELNYRLKNGVGGIDKNIEVIEKLYGSNNE
ncbi:MAG: hypothetical protein A2571_03560 [Candidatus Vogelbacteria bacterium RIFOXYD1_FULL_44_32]|uniref:Nudix hydrolase domain-containing protein n=1 Tax=Candidatus Vogelbacteria bacterium RIFOXYD1_FULL_44_32 TaxID=1802438 RepID=A0A1G2QC09_9BACT|nr:MAG: hypothetical protein A2571_03560 [Candidatus Vogelbacteria bacterium RIFOXYD1_FULL_44_32]